MNIVDKLENIIYDNGNIGLEEALELYSFEDEEALFQAANRIRKRFCGDSADLCSIMNAKSGRCSENCKYCAQSAHYNTGVQEYDLVSKEQALEMSKENESLGIHRFSLVTSGRGLKGKDFEDVVEIYKYINENSKIELCASHGILDYDQLISLKEAGIKRYHHNLETSRKFYPNICTTHSYQHRIDTILSVKKADMEVCSGGIIGMGETQEDRINMAIELRELGVNCIPVNILNPIGGTPLEEAEALSESEILRTIAVFRFILPQAHIRFAGGRSKLSDCGKKGFMSGANAALVGNLLTTVGNNVDEDKKMITELGYDI
jgi:biotin synthase